MKAKSALSLAVVAGVAASATAGNTPANRDLVPLRKAGVMYINMETGERSLTRYDRAAGEIPQVDLSNSTAVLFDYWLVLDENACWDDPRADGFGYFADAPSDSTGTSPITEPIIGFDFGDMPFNSSIGGVILNTATLKTEDSDSDGDGDLDTGYDTSAVYFDALTEGNRTSIAPPTAAVRIQAIPGNRGEIPNGFSDYDLILDFGASSFEMGDTDGANLGDLALSGAAGGFDFSALIQTFSCPTSITTPNSTDCVIVTIPNPNADGLADIQYMQYYSFYNTDNKVTDVSTFIGVATPTGAVSFSTFQTVITTLTPTISTLTSVTTTVTVTVTSTIFIPDGLPAGQSAFEGFGVGALGAGADTGSVDWSVGGCCFWFGGLDCAGFLDQVNDAVDFDATWYNFGPYAQNGGGFLSTDPGAACDNIDYLADGIIDNGDIGAFVGLFIGQDPSTDLNGDGVVDNGDIGTFVQLFLACVG